MKVKDFLRKYNILSKEISNVDFHMNLLNIDLEELKRRIPELKDKNDQEVLKYIALIFKKCDSSNPEYDSKLDEEMVRIGLRTDKFYGGRNHNIWNNGMFHDDGFGFGTEPTSIYDDYIDNEAEKKEKKKILSFDNLWEDICFYDTYKNIISYEKYIKHLSKKYDIEINELLIKIDIARKIAAIKIQQHHIEEEKDDTILKTECREEKIKTKIEHNRERETLEEEIFGKKPSSINNIKKLTKD